MSEMISAEEAQKLLDGIGTGTPEERFDEDIGGMVLTAEGVNMICARMDLYRAAPDLARTVIALHAQLATAKAAQAMVVERAAIAALPTAQDFEAGDDEWNSNYRAGLIAASNRIRALADTDGEALVRELRAERDDAVAKLVEARAVNKRLNTWLDGDTTGLAADRDRLAAANAALEAKVAALVGALEIVAEEATSGEIPGGYMPIETDDWHRGYDAAISKARAALAEVQARDKGEGGE